MSEKTVYAHISPNSVFSVYASAEFNLISPTHGYEVMGCNGYYWYIDDGYHNAINALVSNDGWLSTDFKQDGIGELKFTFTIESHPEFFI